MNSLGLPTGDLRDVLMGSSFFYSRPVDEHGERPEPPGWLGQWSAWGQTAATRFSGADGPLSLNGEVATAILGVDSRRDRWLAGVTLSYSEGEGAYTHPEAAGGAVTSTLTSLNPYVHYRLNERTNLWGVLGYGVGGLTLTPDSAGSGTGLEVGAGAGLRGRAIGGRGQRAYTGGARGHRVRGMGLQRFDPVSAPVRRARVVDEPRFGLGTDRQRRAVAVEPTGRERPGPGRGDGRGAAVPGGVGLWVRGSEGTRAVDAESAGGGQSLRMGFRLTSGAQRRDGP